MKLQPANTGLANVNRPVDVVSYEEYGEDSFYNFDWDKLKKELKFKYFKDLLNSPETFNNALYDYHNDITDASNPEDYQNITLKELIEDFRSWLKYNSDTYNYG
jgi:hypothetical protein